MKRRNHLNLAWCETDARRLALVRLTSLAEMRMAAEDWRALERRSTAPLTWFQTFDWCANWIEVHGGDARRPHVLTLWEDSRLAAVWPLMLEREGIGVTVLRNLGEPHTQYGGVLTENGTVTSAEAETLYQGVTETPGADTAFINLVPKGSPLDQILPASTIVPEIQNEAGHLDLTRFEGSAGYLNSLNKGQRRKRKQRAKLLARQGDLAFEVLRPRMPGFASLVEQCMRFKRTWLEQTGRISSGLGCDDHARFLAGLPASVEGKDGPLLFALTVAGEPAAIEIGFLHHGHYYSYLGGFDWARRDSSPGKVQMEMTVCWLIDNDASAYDLLGNPSEYKQSWTNQTTRLTGHVVNMTAAGRAYSSLWITRARPAIKKLYGVLPSGFRVGIGMIRKLEVWYVG